jgi:hypothetical protein
MPQNKRRLTQTLVSLIDHESAGSVDQAMLTWYCNIRPTGGLRLTDAGYQALEWLDLEQWTVSIADPRTTLTKSLLLALDRKLQYPYYINYKQKHIVFFSSREAMLATLYGDVAQFLRNYS